VVPVPKISHPKKESDFRPISVTPLLSQVLEKLFVRDYFFPSLPNEILASQFAFRPTGSTTAALISFTHNVAELLEESPYVRCVMVDFSRAFDSVPHLALLQKLQRYGVPSYIVSWLANFLTDRTQAVVTHAGTSIKLAITRSIVQGSRIGPISFVAYIGDLQFLGDETS